MSKFYQNSNALPLLNIANAALRNRIETVCRSRGFEVPIICTPEELLEE